MHEGMAAKVQRQLVQLRDREQHLLERLRQRSPVARNVNAGRCGAGSRRAELDRGAPGVASPPVRGLHP